MFGKEEDLKFNDNDLEIIHKEKVNNFLKLTKEKLKQHKMKIKLILRLVDFTKECKERKKHLFSLYKILKNLKEILVKYGINKIYTLEDNDEKLIQYVKKIKYRLENMETLRKLLTNRKTSGSVHFNPIFYKNAKNQIDAHLVIVQSRAIYHWIRLDETRRMCELTYDLLMLEI
ncbi:hypothetical protein RhiirA1_477244 [Rhizophagus irregularis]|uniref:Uncharacterized protein n=1 Tax=Rhizophagus irregularis TaxID=588596 RepID=A0A2N0QTX6_9GLOM|nr:hypothetical protein RhiirA1_477244 [Rhizophagus irregularis]